MNLYERMTANPNVRVSETMPGVFACNFTRKAFYKGIWDNETVKARGLFIDRQGNVLARGFEKFFGIDEYNGPSMQEYLDNAVFPVKAQVKENGYLVIIACINGELTFLSKSGVTDYANHAKDHFYSRFSPETGRLLAILLDQLNASLLVEFVDPDRDPHIVYYSDPDMYILSVVRNSEKFEILPDDVVEIITNITETSGNLFSYKPDYLWPVESQTFYSKDSLEKYLDENKDSFSEGFVLIDSHQNMVKIKSEHYRSVKSYRNSIQRFLKNGAVDDKMSRILVALAQSEHSLAEYVREGIGGHTVIDLPDLAEDLGYETFYDRVDTGTEG